MAVEYGFFLKTSMSALAIAVELARAVSGHREHDDASVVKQLLDPGIDTMDGLWVRVLPGTPSRRHPVITDLEFTPTIRIAYRLDKFRDLEQQTDTMVRLTAALLENSPGDAALTWDLEQVWLLRRNGELTLNERDDLWTPRRLAFIPLPYRRATYSFSDE